MLWISIIDGKFDSIIEVSVMSKDNKLITYLGATFKNLFK